MLNDVLRAAMRRVDNRFILACVAAERSAQLLQGTRPAVDNSKRERVMKLALREIAEEKLTPNDKGVWCVERPASAFEQVFNIPPRLDERQPGEKVTEPLVEADTSDEE